MKRAMFKLGKIIDVASSSGNESFTLHVDVDEWEDDPEWNFPLVVGTAEDVPGTTISVARLNEGVSAQLLDVVFQESLRSMIARDYTFFLQRGFEVSVNDAALQPFVFTFRVSDEIKPARIRYRDGAVEVEITAGMASAPPDDDSAQAAGWGSDMYGWYVACNDRIVLAADKSRQTVWGDEQFTRWHPQYNGFLGLVSFRAADPSQLPWGTTKRNVDVSSPLYRRAITKMKEFTSSFTQYTNARKGNMERARDFETRARPVVLGGVEDRPRMSVPAIATANVEVANIMYQKPKSEVAKAARALGNASMSNRQVGVSTFDYFYEREVEDQE